MAVKFEDLGVELCDRVVQVEEQIDEELKTICRGKRSGGHFEFTKSTTELYLTLSRLEKSELKNRYRAVGWDHLYVRRTEDGRRLGLVRCGPTK